MKIGKCRFVSGCISCGRWMVCLMVGLMNIGSGLSSNLMLRVVVWMGVLSRWWICWLIRL